MTAETYDYIIIGAGSAGCVIANRLSAGSATVCVIEGGGREGAPNVQVPAGILSLYGNPKYDYAYTGTPQPELNNRRIPVNRGKALGGSSTINSMLFIRGACSDYDEWAELGCEGWAWDDVLPVFKALERNVIGQSPDWHGQDGEVFVDRPRDPNPVSAMWVRAGRAAGLQENTDFNDGTQEGLGIYDVTQKDGRRWSSYRAFLKPVEDRPNLTVLSGTETRRLVLEGRRVTGVVVAGPEGEREIRAGREVILSGGAIGSPALLMRSGIGPGEMLKAAGVGVVHDLPGVGQNLRDHVDGMITVRSDSIMTLGLSVGNLPSMIAAPLQWLAARKGMLSTNYVEAGGFARTRHAGTEPDIQFHFVPGYRSHRGKLVEYGHGYAVHTCVLRPKSVGEIRLAADGTMEIDHRFFTAPEDAATLVEGIKLARRILADPVFEAIRGPEILPGPGVQSDDEILAYLRAEALTVYHPVGTCRMGTDPMAVIDPAQMKVRGIEGLRVADASVMPTLIGGNTNVPSMMIGERCARAVLAA
ncbi:GMC family oxidoreductase [Mangrovicoccus algicola]|uniref:GMC family oxidoreductase N-terminal domain-containing protein n=1 Tax=Mangrovicoccus algicola TaxID=2771008 RepID=A0A8J6YZ27_9RHOB|nr:GMC family oxidoreductase N-terminal domain-containing protein [Mangrovicoccus algicola]MBE3639289.1 GMC family oxidoreductase N-terminal domain-containing protein [Mangrovicoccus algicola]